MAVELGNQYKSLSGFGAIWIVRRIITGTGMVPHAVLTQMDDASSVRTISFSVLEDRQRFMPVIPALTVIR